MVTIGLRNQRARGDATMSETEKSYWLLSETSGIGETRDPTLQRALPVWAGLQWLTLGWQDFWQAPLTSIIYGAAVFFLSIAFVWTLFEFGRDYILFPSLAGFLILAPFLAIGLYAKSRAIGAGKTIGIGTMIKTRPRAGGQVFFAGLLLCMLMLLWTRAAVIIWALFFGVVAFPGLDNVIGVLTGSAYGWMMVAVGTAVGGLFAAFAFSISVFAMPMMLDRKIDALTAMGMSMKLVWNNLPVMIGWGAIVSALFAFCVATGLLGMILIFPLLGHATWHAYVAMAQPEA